MGYIVNPSGGGVASVTGWNVDNSDPLNPVLRGKNGNKINETAHVNSSFSGPLIDWNPDANNSITFLRSIALGHSFYLAYSHLLGYMYWGVTSGVNSSRAVIRLKPDMQNGFESVVPLGLTTGFSFILNSQIFLMQRNSAGQNQIKFFDGASVVQQGPIANPSGGAVVDIEARAAIDAILTALENYGLLKL